VDDSDCHPVLLYHIVGQNISAPASESLIKRGRTNDFLICRSRAFVMFQSSKKYFMQQLSDCFQEAVSLKINPSYNKRFAPHVLGLVFKRSSTSLQYALDSLRQELRNRRIELYFYLLDERIGISLVCKEENISVNSNMLVFDPRKMDVLMNNVEQNEKLVLAFYSLTRDNRMRILHDRNAEPFFLPVYFSSSNNFPRENKSAVDLRPEIADELCSFIFDQGQWKN
jgi:hypothetical protein